MNLKMDSAETAETEQIERYKAQAHMVMNIDLVLAKVGHYISAKDALQLRMTCKGWNDNLIPGLKQSHKPIKLQTNRNVFGTNDTVTVRVPLMLAEYVNVMDNNSQGIPFSKYSFGSGCHRPASSPNDHLEQVQGFISTNGTQIKRLGLHLDDQFPLPLLRRIVFEWTPQLEELNLKLDRGWDRREVATDQEPFVATLIPQLKKLDAEFEDSYSDNALPTPFLEVMRSSPKLHWLKLNLPSSMPREFLSAALQDRRLDELKSLEISRELRRRMPIAAELSILKDLGERRENALRLRALSLAYTLVSSSSFDQGVVLLLAGFLRSQAPSLQQLKINLDSFVHFGNRNAVVDVSLPRLQQLKALELSRHGLSQPEFHYTGASFADTFPALERFSYRHHYENGNQTDAAAASSDIERLGHPTVSELELESYPGNAALFPARCPSVTKLQLFLHSASYRNPEIDWANLIWTSWPTLTSLDVSIVVKDLMGGAQLDELLSGVEMINMDEVNRQLNSMMEPRLDILHDLQAKYKTRPGLTDLKQLQKLRLQVWGGSDEKLDDVGGYLGLSLAVGVGGSRLRCIEISVNVSNSISKRCEAYLRTLLPIHAVLNLPNSELRSRKRKLSSNE